MGPVLIGVHPKSLLPCKVSSFSENEWASVTARATHTLLPKMNFNRNTSRIAVYGLRRLGGIGLTHGYARQGAESVCHLLNHIRWGGDLGTVMMSVLSQVQLLSGRGVGILENPIQRPKRNANKKAHIYKWHHLGIGWFQSMIMFLHTINGSIILKDLWTPHCYSR